MAYQSRQNSITLHLTEPIRVIYEMKPCTVREITYRNPYEVKVYEQNDFCYLNIKDFGCFRIKETMEEVCKMLDIFVDDFNKEFDRWYNNLPSDPELRRLATGGK